METMTFILLGFLITAYLLIGQIVVSWLYGEDYIDFSVPNAWIGHTWAVIFFPIVIIWVGIRELANWLTESLF